MYTLIFIGFWVLLISTVTFLSLGFDEDKNVSENKKLICMLIGVILFILFIIHLSCMLTTWSSLIRLEWAKQKIERLKEEKEFLKTKIDENSENEALNIEIKRRIKDIDKKLYGEEKVNNH